jgi:16S rRNA (guanine966-N2)-methyltransferase
LRIVAGDLRGRTLRTPPGRILRPTQGHVRQVLFDVVGEGIVDARVLDLFAGVGALGIEALSRGAREATFVERDTAILRFLRENVEAMGLAERCRVLGVSVNAALRILAEEEGAFRWIFADPPYGQSADLWLAQVDRAGVGGILAAGGSLVLEMSKRDAANERVGALRRYRTHEVGETKLEFFGWEGK